MKHQALILFLAFVFQPTAYADDHEELVEEYIAVSGFDEVFASIPGLIQSSIDKSLARSSNPDIERKYYQSLTASFDPATMKQQASDYLLDNTDSEYLEGMIEWYASPLGSKMKQAGIEANRPENKPELIAYIKDVQTNKPRRSRIDMIIRVEEVTNSAGILTELSTTVMRAVVDARAAMIDDAESIEADVRQIEKLKPVLKENFRRQLVLVSFYTYRDFEDKELYEVIKFYRSPLGKQEIALTGEVVVRVLGDWFSDALNRIAEQIKIDDAMKSAPSLTM